jgi:hypothetical protein
LSSSESVPNNQKHAAEPSFWEPNSSCNDYEKNIKSDTTSILSSSESVSKNPLMKQNILHNEINQKHAAEPSFWEPNYSCGNDYEENEIQW